MNTINTELLLANIKLAEKHVEDAQEQLAARQAELAEAKAALIALQGKEELPRAHSGEHHS